jgi:hypothetical protein
MAFCRFEDGVFVIMTDGRHRYHIVQCDTSSENPDSKIQKRKRGSASTTDLVSKTTRGGSQTVLKNPGKTAFDLVGGPFRRQELSLELSPEPDLNDDTVCKEAQFDERKEKAGRRQTEVFFFLIQGNSLNFETLH